MAAPQSRQTPGTRPQPVYPLKDVFEQQILIILFPDKILKGENCFDLRPTELSVGSDRPGRDRGRAGSRPHQGFPGPHSPPAAGKPVRYGNSDGERCSAGNLTILSWLAVCNTYQRSLHIDNNACCLVAEAKQQPLLSTSSRPPSTPLTH